MAAFFDELTKIADNMIASKLSDPAAPAKIPSGIKPPSPMKADTKPTNYTTVNTQQPEGQYDAADSYKSMPPPPVRT
jgi:hypothetical protein